MKLDVTLWGSHSDVNLFSSQLKVAFPNIDFVEVDCFPGNYPKCHSKDDTDLIIKIFSLRGGDKK